MTKLKHYFLKRIPVFLLLILGTAVAFVGWRPFGANEKAVTDGAQQDGNLRSTPVKIVIATSFGDIVVELSDKTPAHRDSFVHYTTLGYFDTTTFHRIVPGFVVQGGDSDAWYEQASGGLALFGKRRIPAEFDSSLFHQYGAFGLGRDENPEKAGFLTQFYIVTGRVYTHAELNEMETKQRQGKPFSPKQREIYTTRGGIPRLDDRYVVFGQVVKGMDIVEKISQRPRKKDDSPVVPIPIKVKIPPQKEK